MRDDLHLQLDALIPKTSSRRSQIRLIIHAMIDFGYVDRLECQWDECGEPSRAFTAYPEEKQEAGSFNRDRHRIAIDHVVPIYFGGADRVENLQVVHQTCNQRKSVRRSQSAETRAKISAAQTAAWAGDDGTRRDALAASNASRPPLTDEVRNRRSESLKRYYADPANRKKHSERCREAWSTEERRQTQSELSNRKWDRYREEAEHADQS